MFILNKKQIKDDLFWELRNDSNYNNYLYVDLSKEEIQLIELMWNKSDYNYENQPIAGIYLNYKNELEVITDKYYGNNLLIVPFINVELANELKEKYYPKLLELHLKFRRI